MKLMTLITTIEWRTEMLKPITGGKGDREIGHETHSDSSLQQLKPRHLSRSQLAK
jgi:hypothetical protein